MKPCPYCAEDIQDAAIVCKHCGRDLKSGATQVQVVQTPPKTSLATIGCGTIIVLFVIGWVMNMVSPPSPTTITTTKAPSSAPAAAPVSQSPPLELLASRGYPSDSGNYLIVEGRVRNATSTRLEQVAVSVTWKDKAGGFITTDTGMVDLNPLLPGQTSSFKTMTRRNPEMALFTVEFKKLFGGSIDHVDKSEDTRKKT